MYDSLGRLDEYYKFGNLFQKVGYHTAAGQQGAVAWVEDALLIPRRTNFNNYKRGMPQQIIRADSSTLGRVVDDNGWITQETNGSGVATSYSYNSVGWLTFIDRAAPWSDSSFSYTAAGSGITQTSTRASAKVTTSYDSLTRRYLMKTEATSGGGATSYVATDYNALSQVTFTSFPSSSSSPSDGTSTTYDALGRKKVIAENVYPNATTTISYLVNNRSYTTDPEGDVTMHHYHAYGAPANGELHQISQPMGVYTRIYRDDYGQPTRIRQFGNHNGYNLDRSNYIYYDSSLRLCRYHTPEGGYTAYAYNEANEVTSYAKGVSGPTCSAPSGGSLVTLSYDDLGRLKTTDFANSATPDITRTYDANGNILTLNRVNTTPYYNVNWTYSYDNADNLRSERIQLRGRTYDLAYDYDANGHLIERTLPSGAVIDYALNGLGQVTEVAKGTTIFADNIIYFESGTVQSADYGNGHALSTTRTVRQQPRLVYVHKGATEAIEYLYTYNARGQLITEEDYADVLPTSNHRTYGYDDLGRLTTATGPWGSGSFTYDPLGNLRQKTLGPRTVTVSYDAVANRATQSTDTAGSTRSIGYDIRGNTTSLGTMSFLYDKSDQPYSQPGVASYLYDGNRKRSYQWINGKDIYSVYDASGTMVHRDNIDDSKVTEYVSAAGATVRLEYGVATYVYKNHLGSPVTGADAGGNILWRERYTPFGEKLLNPAANKDEPGHTGHIQDDATGLTYMQARYFDPVIGRFLSIDPKGFSPSRPYMFNRYAYVGNDPTNAIDPNGESTTVIGAEIGCAVSGPACPAGAAIGALIGTGIGIGIILIANEIADDADDGEDPGATEEDATDRVTGGAKPDRETTKGTGIFENPPTGESADEIMDDVKNLDGASTETVKGSRGSVNVVTLPDGSRVIDRGSKAGPRTIEVPEQQRANSSRGEIS